MPDFILRIFEKLLTLSCLQFVNIHLLFSYKKSSHSFLFIPQFSFFAFEKKSIGLIFLSIFYNFLFKDTKHIQIKKKWLLIQHIYHSGSTIINIGHLFSFIPLSRSPLPCPQIILSKF